MAQSTEIKITYNKQGTYDLGPVTIHDNDPRFQKRIGDLFKPFDGDLSGGWYLGDFLRRLEGLYSNDKLTPMALEMLASDITLMAELLSPNLVSNELIISHLGKSRVL